MALSLRAFLFSAICLSSLSALAQPGDVTGIDIRLVDAGPSTLEVQLRPNAAWSFTDGIVNFTFAIAWESASGGTLNVDLIDQVFQGGPPFCMLVAAPLSGNPGIVGVDNNGTRYTGFNVSGNQMPGACAFAANAWVPVARIPVTGVSGCANFRVVAQDAFLTSNNSNWFISLGGVNITANSQVVGPPVQIGACTVDCNGVVGGPALPGTPCTAVDPCVQNAVLNAECQCVGEAVPPPSVNAIASSSPVCSDAALQLSVEATGTGPLTFVWAGAGTFVNGNTAAQVTVTDAESGTYTVLVTDGCGSVEASVAVEVTQLPAASIAYPAGAFCANEASVLPTVTGTPGGTFSATSGLAIDPATGALLPLASTPGDHVVTYTLPAAGGCPAVIAQTNVTVNAVPAASTGSYGPLCSTDAPITLVGSPLGGTWSGTGVSGDQFDPSAGSSTVTYSLTQNGCTGSASTVIVVNATPIVSVGTYVPLCSTDEPITLVGSPFGGSWSGTGVSGDQFDPSAGSSTVTYSLTQNGCTGSASTAIVVNATPTVSVGSVGPLCSSDAPITLVGSPLGGTWSGNGVSGDQFNPSAGSSTVTYSLTQNGCTGSANTEIVVNATPIVSVGTYAPLCSTDAPLTLVGSPFGGSWSGTGVSGDQFDPSAGGSTVTYSLTQNGCTGSASTAIVVNPSPTVAFEAEGTEFLVGVPVQFTNGSSEGSYQWSFGDGGSSTEQDPLHTYTVPGDYTVTLTVESDGCTASADLALTVDVGTGTTVRGALALHAWHVPGEWVIQLPEGISGPLVLDVLDASGRLHQREQLVTGSTLVRVADRGAPTGVWLLQLRQVDGVQVIRVPVVR